MSNKLNWGWTIIFSGIFVKLSSANMCNWDQIWKRKCTFTDAHKRSTALTNDDWKYDCITSLNYTFGYLYIISFLMRQFCCHLLFKSGQYIKYSDRLEPPGNVDVKIYKTKVETFVVFLKRFESVKNSKIDIKSVDLNSFINQYF